MIDWISLRAFGSMPGERFIQQDERGFEHKSPGRLDASTLPAGQGIASLACQMIDLKVLPGASRHTLLALGAESR